MFRTTCFKIFKASHIHALVARRTCRNNGDGCHVRYYKKLSSVKRGDRVRRSFHFKDGKLIKDNQIVCVYNTNGVKITGKALTPNCFELNRDKLAAYTTVAQVHHDNTSDNGESQESQCKICKRIIAAIFGEEQPDLDATKPKEEKEMAEVMTLTVVKDGEFENNVAAKDCASDETNAKLQSLVQHPPKITEPLLENNRDPQQIHSPYIDTTVTDKDNLLSKETSLFAISDKNSSLTTGKNELKTEPVQMAHPKDPDTRLELATLDQNVPQLKQENNVIDKSQFINYSLTQPEDKKQENYVNDKQKKKYVPMKESYTYCTNNVKHFANRFYIRNTHCQENEKKSTEVTKELLKIKHLENINKLLDCGRSDKKLLNSKLNARILETPDEKLVQKVEKINETSLVEAEKQDIDGFNVAPNTLQTRAIDITKDSTHYISSKQSKSDCNDDMAEYTKTRKEIDKMVETIINRNKLIEHSTSHDKSPEPSINLNDSLHSRRGGSSEMDEYDKIASRCLKSPNNKIDERIVEEMGKFGVANPAKGQTTPAIDEDLVQMDVMKKPKDPALKMEIILDTKNTDDLTQCTHDITANDNQNKEDSSLNMKQEENTANELEPNNIQQQTLLANNENETDLSDTARFRSVTHVLSDPNILIHKPIPPELEEIVDVFNKQKEVEYQKKDPEKSNSEESKQAIIKSLGILANESNLELPKDETNVYNISEVKLSDTPNEENQVDDKAKSDDTELSFDLQPTDKDAVKADVLMKDVLESDTKPHSDQEQSNVDPNLISKQYLQAREPKNPSTDSSQGNARADVMNTQSVPMLSKIEAEDSELLSVVLEKVRLRNQLQFCQALEKKIDTVLSSCGKTKPPCPPPPPKCPAPVPPPKPCPPIPPKCPSKPSKPACKPTTPGPCNPPKTTKCPPPTRPSCPPVNKFSDNIKNLLSSILRPINGHIPKLWPITDAWFRSCSLSSHRSFCLSSTKDSGINLVKDFEPWVPIPSWPIPKKETKKALVCPKEGCPTPLPPCAGGPTPKTKHSPCKHFPKRNSFSLPDMPTYTTE